jgi:hypothetical protein
MPATTANGFKKYAVVVAKLIDGDVIQGSRHFLVPVCNEKQMYRGVTSFRLPPRPGTNALDFSLTHFNHVLLPHSALLGDERESTGSRQGWWEEISRIPIGTLAISLPVLQGLKQAAFIAGKYSQHRHILSKGLESVPIPIISFRTQQIPLLEATATAHVLNAWWPIQVKVIQSKTLPFEVRHAAATIFKTVVLRRCIYYAPLLAERCGAQGTLEPNFMLQLEVSLNTFST